MTASGGEGARRIAVRVQRMFSRRESLRQLGLLGLGATAGVSFVSACAKDAIDADGSAAPKTSGTPSFAHQSGDAGGFAWPAGLVAMWDFQEDPKGGNTVTSRLGEPVVLTARDNKVVVKDLIDPGPFGPSLVLDGGTVFVKDGDIGGLDVTRDGGTQVTVVDWVNDTAGNHDDTATGLAFRAGSHCEGGVMSARQYGSYFDSIAYIGSAGHYTPFIGAQDGPSPGYPYVRDYAASARKYFTGVGQGQWHMEAFTYDGEKIIAYVDGLADEWKAVPEPAPWVSGFTLRQTVDRNPFFLGKPINNSPTTKRFTIGGAVLGDPLGYPGVNFTTGKLGGVAVFDRALTAEEIMAIRLGTLRPGEPITTYSFEVTGPGPRPLSEIGWTATAGPDNADVSAGVDEDYRVSRPSDATKAFLRKISPAIGAAWVPLTGLSTTQVKRVRFKLISEKPKAAPQRLLVRVGDKWWASGVDYVAYVAPKDHSGDTALLQAKTVNHALSWERGKWKAVTLQPGALSVDNSANGDPIPDGPLTAIGFLSEGGDGSIVLITDLELFAV